MAKIRLFIINSHPVSYHLPIYRSFHNDPEIESKVFFLWNVFTDNYKEREKNWLVEYDRSSLNGYVSEFLRNVSPFKGDSFWGMLNPSVFKLIDPKCVDAVFLFGYSRATCWIILAACWLKNIPIIYKGESDLLNNVSFFKRVIKKAILTFFFKGICVFTYSYKQNANYYLNYGASQKQLTFMPCSVDNDYLQSLVNKIDNKSIRTDIKVGSNSKIILFCGRFIDRKRPLLLIEALRLLKQQDKNIVLLMIGSGKLESHIKNMVEKYCLEENVRIVGFVKTIEQLAKYYLASDLLVLPSIHDPSPKVINESMNFSLPVVVSDLVGTANDLVIHKYNGMVFEHDNLEDLVLKITLALNENNLSRLSKNAKQTIPLWSNEKGIENVKSVLKKVTHGTKG